MRTFPSQLTCNFLSRFCNVQTGNSMHLGTLSRSYLPRCKPPSPKRIVRIYEPNKWANIPQFLVWTLSLSYQFWSTVCPTWEVFEYSIIYRWVESLARFCPSYLTIHAQLLWFYETKHSLKLYSCVTLSSPDKSFTEYFNTTYMVHKWQEERFRGNLIHHLKNINYVEHCCCKLSQSA